ncbi:HAD family acid phosphatase [Glaciibacter flavus]|uniref:HAD family acid phosphatase n=1 Tax=Orlajensenia flava TaxID=2565934 RepID=UPI003B00BD92
MTTTPRNPAPRRTRRIAAVALTAALTVGLSIGGATAANANGWDHGGGGGRDASLTPRTQFTMAPDGSSGATEGGEGIPNVDSDKKTIATYYGDPGTGVANKVASPYISEMAGIVADAEAKLKPAYDSAIAAGQKPAIVFDADDTTLWTYDMEVGDMHFTFDPAEQDVWVQDQRFPATPSMVGFVSAAARMGFTVFGLTGRNDDQKAATVANLAKVGYTDFPADRFYTKWTGVGASQQPSYVTCAAVKCTTVEYKAQTRKHIEQDLGYDITLNVGDQWSDLQGGFADSTLKLPNPTYYLPSPDLPGVNEPNLTPRMHFTMAADGSSGATEGGEGIPNVDSVKKTIAAYYGDTGAGISNKTDSPYISEMHSIVAKKVPAIALGCVIAKALHRNPAVVLDADDTTLWTYDMEVGDMHFTFNPTEQNIWVQDERFPATPSMVSAATLLKRAGCTIVGLTGRNDDQKAATLGNLAKVGYTGFTAQNYYTKWTGVGASQQPSYITCAAAKCTTIEYKSQTRAHVESASGGKYTVIANFGDQFSDLIGGHSLVNVKLPNPTYYLP